MSVSHSKYIHYGQSIFTWRTKMPRKFRRRWQSHVPRNKWPALRILFEKWNRLEFFYALKFLARTFYTIYMLIMILTISHTPCTNVQHGSFQSLTWIDSGCTQNTFAIEPVTPENEYTLTWNVGDDNLCHFTFHYIFKHKCHFPCTEQWTPIVPLSPWSGHSPIETSSPFSSF